MSYAANLTNNQRLAIANQGNQTIISLVSTTTGQQQSQTSSFTTGVWHTPPQLYQVGTSFVLKLNSGQNIAHILIQSNGISTIAAPTLDNAIEVELQKTDDTVIDSSSVSFEPMQPMQPMKMGNMSMDINSMSMQMGNMSLNMNNNKTSTSAKVFCSQCGQQAKPNARFCSSCGHKLDE